MADDGAALQHAFGFSAEELALNRSGSVSPRQQALLTKSSKTVKAFSLVMIVVVVVFAGVAGGIAASSSSELVLPVVGVVLLVGLVMGTSIRRTMRAGGRVALANVQHAQGPAKHHAVWVGANVDQGDVGGRRYEIEVGGQRLFVGSEANMQTFVEGAPYAVHYVREASLHMLLSAEPV
jgi:hypothetical protein